MLFSYNYNFYAIALSILDYILVNFYPRKVNPGSTIKFDNKVYIAFNNNDKQQLLTPKSKVLVLKNLKDELFMIDDYNGLYSLVELSPEEVERRTINRKTPLTRKSKPKHYRVPTFTHPWREYSVKDIITYLDYHPEDFDELFQ